VSTFRSGEGIAGQTFRLGRANVFYVPEGPGADPQPGFLNLLYRERDQIVGEERREQRHRWIIELPILLDKGGQAIGTLGFAQRIGELRTGAADVWLGRAAHDLIFAPDAAESLKKTLNAASQRASRSFWEIWSDEHHDAKEIFRSWTQRRPRP
jgi:hypothetical protein